MTFLTGMSALKPKFVFHKNRRDLEIEYSGLIRIADVAPAARKERLTLDHAEGLFETWKLPGQMTGGYPAKPEGKIATNNSIAGDAVVALRGGLTSRRAI